MQTTTKTRLSARRETVREAATTRSGMQNASMSFEIDGTSSRITPKKLRRKDDKTDEWNEMMNEKLRSWMERKERLLALREK